MMLCTSCPRVPRFWEHPQDVETQTHADPHIQFYRRACFKYLVKRKRTPKSERERERQKKSSSLDVKRSVEMLTA